jgi:nucleoside-diphosphate-sugar epimerase
MTYLITGYTGYIGNQLATALFKNGEDVCALVRPRSNLSKFHLNQSIRVYEYNGDYSSIENIFAKEKIEAVFHLAAQGGYDDDGLKIKEMIDANITLGTQLLQAMSTHDCAHFINTGTYWQHAQDPQKNTSICLYAATKQAFEEIIDYYVITKKINAITFKLFDVYGPYDHRRKIFQLLYEAAQSQQPLAMSAGNQRLNLIYIDDVINVYKMGIQYLKNMLTPGHKRFFVPGAEQKSLKEIVQQYEKILKKTIPVIWGKLPYREQEIMIPPIGETFPGWKCQINLEEGLTKMLTDQNKISMCHTHE